MVLIDNLPWEKIIVIIRKDNSCNILGEPYVFAIDEKPSFSPLVQHKSSSSLFVAFLCKSKFLHLLSSLKFKHFIILCSMGHVDIVSFLNVLIAHEDLLWVF